MPLLSFKAEFADAVANGVHAALTQDGFAEREAWRRLYPDAGIKRQTIRAFRKDHRDPKPGDTLYLWTRLRHRTLPAIKLGEVVCRETMGIAIKQVGRRLGLALADVVQVHPFPISSGVLEYLAERPLHELARADGFETWPDLLAFIEKTHGLPFHGLVIRW